MKGKRKHRNGRVQRSKRSDWRKTSEVINPEEVKMVNDVQVDETVKVDLDKLSKRNDCLEEIIDQVESDSKAENEKSPKKWKRIAVASGSVLLALVATGIVSYELGINNGPGNVAISSKTGTVLKNDELYSEFVGNPENRSVILNELMNKLLHEKYGHDQDKEAKERLDKMASQMGQEEFKTFLNSTGLTKEVYLMNVQNRLMIKDAIYNEYKPSKDMIKDKYLDLKNRYKITGIYVTARHQDTSQDDLNRETDEIKRKIESGELSFKDAVKIKTKDVVVSGIGKDDRVTNDEINSNDYVTLSTLVKEELAKKSEGDLFVVDDTKYGNAIIKVDKIDKKASLKKETPKLIKEIKTQMSLDNDQQALFVSKLFEEYKVKSDYQSIEQVIGNAIKSAK